MHISARSVGYVGACLCVVCALFGSMLIRQDRPPSAISYRPYTGALPVLLCWWRFVWPLFPCCCAVRLRRFCLVVKALLWSSCSRIARVAYLGYENPPDPPLLFGPLRIVVNCSCCKVIFGIFGFFLFSSTYFVYFVGLSLFVCGVYVYISGHRTPKCPNGKGCKDFISLCLLGLGAYISGCYRV